MRVFVSLIKNILHPKYILSFVKSRALKTILKRDQLTPCLELKNTADKDTLFIE